MEIKTVGVKELKNNLSAYLREVRRGTRLLVTDRDRVVAEICEPGSRYEAGTSTNPLLEEWARQGRVMLPTRAKAPLERTGLKFPAGTAERWIREDRDEE